MPAAYLYESFLFLFFSRCFIQRKRPLCTALVSAAFLGLYFVFKLYMESAYYLNLPGMTLLCGLYFLLIGDIPRENCLFLGGIFSIGIELGRTLVYGSLQMNGLFDFYLRYELPLRLLAMLLKTILVMSFRHLLRPYLFCKIGTLDHILLLIPFGYLIFMRASLLYKGYLPLPDQHFGRQVLFMTTFSTLLSTAALVFHISSEYQRSEIEQMKERIRQEYQDTADRQQMDIEVMRIYHDLKNQLIALSGPQQEQQSAELAHRLLQQVESYEKIAYTGSSVLNALLNHKTQTAQQQGVTLHLFIEKNDYLFLDSMDLCSIVGNALDNAIEAASRLPDPEQRSVQLRMFFRQGVWALKVENPYEGQLSPLGGGYRSSKPDPLRHGIGLRSIRYCVQKNGGQMKIETEGQRFILRITIPMPEPSCSV